MWWTGLIVFLHILLVPQSSPAASQTLKITDIRENIYASAILTDFIYVIAGDRGAIFRSEDMGATWTAINSGFRRPFFDLSFPDKTNGWIVGSRGVILHTSDAGSTWEKQNSGTENHLFSVDFLDEQQGCAVGDWGRIVCTKDGGRTWQDVSLPEDVILYGISFSKPSTGWIVGEFGKVFKTSDSGQSWQSVSFPFPVESSFFCIDTYKDSIFLAGLDGLIVYSKDGGTSWQQAKNNFQGPIYSISINDQSGWATGDSGAVIRSTDGGEHWLIQSVPESTKLFWIGTISQQKTSAESIGFGAGANGLIFYIRPNGVVWNIEGGKQ